MKITSNNLRTVTLKENLFKIECFEWKSEIYSLIKNVSVVNPEDGKVQVYFFQTGELRRIPGGAEVIPVECELVYKRKCQCDVPRNT